MQQFTIKEVERLSGIKAHTLRVWEQRYGLFQPTRKESNHRLYTNEDLKTILRVVYLYNNGFKISRIARLGEQDLLAAIQGNLTAENHYQVAILQLTEAVVDYDEERFERVLNNLIIHLGFERTILDVVYPFLDRLGMLWVTERILPAQEHIASNLIRKKIIVATEGIERAAIQRDMVIALFAPEGEWHEIPLLFINYQLRRQGYRTAYFGVNVPFESMRAYYALHRPQVIHAHVVSNLQAQEPAAFAAMLREHFPDACIVISGPVAAQLDAAEHPDLRLLSTQEQFDRYFMGGYWPSS